MFLKDCRGLFLGKRIEWARLIGGNGAGSNLAGGRLGQISQKRNYNVY